jgi:hypothetical protein
MPEALVHKGGRRMSGVGLRGGRRSCAAGMEANRLSGQALPLRGALGYPRGLWIHKDSSDKLEGTKWTHDL